MTECREFTPDRAIIGHSYLDDPDLRLKLLFNPPDQHVVRGIAVHLYDRLRYEQEQTREALVMLQGLRQPGDGPNCRCSYCNFLRSHGVEGYV